VKANISPYNLFLRSPASGAHAEFAVFTGVADSCELQEKRIFSGVVCSLLMAVCVCRLAGAAFEQMLDRRRQRCDRFAR
jgi:hypothetical protein